MGQKTMILAVVIIIITVIISVLFVVSRVRRPSNKPAATSVTQTSTRNVVPVAEILNSPVTYNGYNLEVDSGISDWVTNKSFFVSGGAAGGGGLFGGGSNRQLLVIAKQPFNLPQDPNDGKVGLGELTRVTAYGQIRILNREQLETVLGIDLDGPEIALDNNNINKWDLGPVLLLDRVEVNKIAR